MKTDKVIKHEGVEIRLVLKDFYCNIGGRIEQTTVLNPGTDKEKILPTTTASVPDNYHLDFGQTQEEIDKFVSANPEIASLIALALSKAAEAYK